MEMIVLDRRQTECLWIVSDDSGFCSRVEAAVGEKTSVRTITCDLLKDDDFWRETPTLPAVVLIDLGEDLDLASCLLRKIKRSRINAPLVVVSREINKEFAAKIVSEGVSYCLQRDFSPEELCEVVEGLTRAQRSDKG